MQRRRCEYSLEEWEIKEVRVGVPLTNVPFGMWMTVWFISHLSRLHLHHFATGFEWVAQFQNTFALDSKS